MDRHRVALTGMGMITPLGVGIAPLWEGLMTGRSGVRRAQGFEVAGLPVDHYAELPAIDYNDYLDRQRSAHWSRCSKAAVVAALQARRDAGLEAVDTTRLGVLLGTGYGCTYELEGTFQTWERSGWKRIKPVTVPRCMPNAPASLVALELQARGLTTTISSACSSGALAVGMAVNAIRSGSLDLCCAGGVDVFLNASTAASWCALRVLSQRNDATACRPFSADRDGLVLGEGSCFLILEQWRHAADRGARIYAELSGVGLSNDAANIVDPDLEGELLAVRAALADAALEPRDVDYVSAHDTATQANDSTETAVLKAALGEHAGSIPVSAIKGHLGHTMGAAGAIEVAATALALQHQRVPPTLNYQAPDPSCDLDYVTDGPRSLTLRHALSNSFGFGGQNAVLILSRAPTG